MPERAARELSVPQLIDQQVRPLAAAFRSAGLLKLRVRTAGCTVELRRSGAPAPDAPGQAAAPAAAPAPSLDVITADLVGIVHFARPAPVEGALLDDDRELAYVEALGIRNPVRSRGAGSIVAVNVSEGQPVDYGQALFTIDRATV